MSSSLSLLFPKFCVGCGFIGAYLCDACFRKIHTTKTNRCIYCKKKSVLGLTHILCEKKWGIGGHISAYKYDSLFKKIMIQSKYKRAHLLLRDVLNQTPHLFFKTIWRWKQLFEPVISAVPLHPQRERERGFNQSGLITDHIESLMGIPQKKLLIRTKNTEHLANVQDHNKRRAIIKNSFKYIETTIPKTAILVDDVLTSGATIEECARILKKNGVETVLAISLAK